MVHLSELQIRTLEHDLRVNRANRSGWLLSSTQRAGRKSRLGAVLSAVGARLAPSTSPREVPGLVPTMDALATANGSRSLA